MGTVSAINESALSGKPLPVDATTGGGSTAIASVFDEVLRWDLVDGPGVGWEWCFAISITR